MSHGMGDTFLCPSLCNAGNWCQRTDKGSGALSHLAVVIDKERA